MQQALVGNNTDEEVLFSPVPKTEGDDNIDISNVREPNEEVNTTFLLYSLLQVLVLFNKTLAVKVFTHLNTSLLLYDLLSCNISFLLF